MKKNDDTSRHNHSPTRLLLLLPPVRCSSSSKKRRRKRRGRAPGAAFSHHHHYSLSPHITTTCGGDVLHPLLTPSFTSRSFLSSSVIVGAWLAALRQRANVGNVDSELGCEVLQRHHPHAAHVVQPWGGWRTEKGGGMQPPPPQEIVRFVTFGALA